MDWKAVRQDKYYQARELEAKARQGNEGRLWEEYAEFKMSKASYLLGIHGYINAIGIYQTKSNEVKRVVGLYNKAIDVARRADYTMLVILLGYELAQIHEGLKEWSECINCYEEVGKFCEEKAYLGKTSYFYAADAYEHAAEIMRKAGKGISSYMKPVEMWQKNAEYWRRHGDSGDAEWSLRHVELYKELFGLKEGTK